MAENIRNAEGQNIINTHTLVGNYNIRSSASMDGTIKTTLSKGTTISVYMTEGTWSKIYEPSEYKDCWVSSKGLSSVISSTTLDGSTTSSSDSSNDWSQESYQSYMDEQYTNLGKDGFNAFNEDVYDVYTRLNEYADESEKFDVDSDEYKKMQQFMFQEYQASSSLIDQLVGSFESYFSSDIQLHMISGMPPQFNALADPRIMDTNEKAMYTSLHAYGDGIGRMFQHYVAEDIPLVLIKPGKPKFMPSVSIFDRTKITKAVRQKLWDQDESEGFTSSIKNKSLEEVLAEYNGDYNDTRYYGFQADYETYCKYVNTMCRHTAVKMGLSDYSNFNISSEDGYGLKNFILRNSLGFFFDKEATSESDSASTSVGESQLAGTLKSAGSVVREAQFIFGAGEAANRGSEAQEKYQSEMENLMGTVKTDPSSFFGRIKNSGKTLFTGGNLLFPEIWQDSSYSKSYTLGFNLFTPYGDKEAIFRDIYVPFYSLLALTLPRQITAQGYTAPFVLKVATQGWFSSDMCMISSFSFDKGENDGWTKDGYPLSIKVSMSLTDLYPVLMMSTDKHTRILSNNTGLIEFMDAMAGITFTDYDPWRQLEMALAARWNVIGDIPYSIQNKMINSIDSVANKVNKFLFR